RVCVTTSASTMLTAVWSLSSSTVMPVDFIMPRPAGKGVDESIETQLRHDRPTCRCRCALLPAGHLLAESAPEHARAIEGHLLRVVAVHARIRHDLLHYLVAVASRLVDGPGEPHFLVLL